MIGQKALRGWPWYCPARSDATPGMLPSTSTRAFGPAIGAKPCTGSRPGSATRTTVGVRMNGMGQPGAARENGVKELDYHQLSV